MLAAGYAPFAQPENGADGMREAAKNESRKRQDALFFWECSAGAVAHRPSVSLRFRLKSCICCASIADVAEIGGLCR